ncbi:hypothetical protein ACFU8W_44425 [Streptomyces sp. NPDC057565]|uniref:hypothetical protein n=1 Tax=Streptomyces sp. NPDC057565 TaxID=3346169 RepID=UPI0036C7E7A8
MSSIDARLISVFGPAVELKWRARRLARTMGSARNQRPQDANDLAGGRRRLADAGADFAEDGAAGASITPV